MAAQTCNEHSGCIEAITNLKESDGKQWEAINAIKNRPPVWMSLLFSLALCVIGLLIGLKNGST